MNTQQKAKRRLQVAHALQQFVTGTPAGNELGGVTKQAQAVQQRRPLTHPVQTGQPITTQQPPPPPNRVPGPPHAFVQQQPDVQEGPTTVGPPQKRKHLQGDHQPGLSQTREQRQRERGINQRYGPGAVARRARRVKYAARVGEAQADYRTWSPAHIKEAKRLGYFTKRFLPGYARKSRTLHPVKLRGRHDMADAIERKRRRKTVRGTQSRA